jgi:hypothetical protein
VSLVNQRLAALPGRAPQNGSKHRANGLTGATVEDAARVIKSVPCAGRDQWAEGRRISEAIKEIFHRSADRAPRRPEEIASAVVWAWRKLCKSATHSRWVGESPRIGSGPSSIDCASGAGGFERQAR